MTQYADYTYLSGFLQCPLQWHFKYERKLVPLQDEKSMPMLAGSLGHRLLQVHYEGGDVAAALKDLYPVSGIEPFGDYAYMTQGHFETILLNYADEYPNDKDFRTVTMIEEPLISEVLRFGGIPDMIVETAEGELEIWDHKWTTGWMSRLESRHQLSRQFPLYAIMAEELTGRPVRRAVLNGVYMGEYASRQTSKAEKFLRRGYDFTAYQLEKARQWIDDVRQLIDTQTKVMHPGQHCDWCKYKRLCEAPTSTIEESMIRTYYRVREVTGALLSGADMGD